MIAMMSSYDNYYNTSHKEEKKQQNKKKKNNSSGSGGWQWRCRVDQLQISGPLISRAENKKKRRRRCGDWRLVGDDGPAPPLPPGKTKGGPSSSDGGLVALL